MQPRRGRTEVARIIGLSADGLGLARVRGRTVEVAGTIPGETIEMAECADARGRLVWDLVSVREASPHRVTPPCAFVASCGGCAWQHIAYSEQLRLKRDRVAGLLREAVGRFVPRIEPTIGAAADAPGGAPWGFRNKVHFVLERDRSGRVAMGHYRRGSRAIVPVSACPVHAEAGNAAAFAMQPALERAAAAAATRTGRDVGLRHLVVRTTEEGRTLATLVVATDDARVARALAESEALATLPVDGLSLNVNPGAGPALFGRDTEHVSGRTRVEERVAGVTFLLSPTGFFQTNVRAAARLVDAVLEAVPPGLAHVVDLYAGCGLFALPLARRGHQVVAVEENPVSLADGRDSLALNAIPAERCRFIRARVEHFLHRRRAAMETIRQSADVVLLDPPREGCPPGVLETVLREMSPERAVYVSCDPEALARDLGRVSRDRLIGPAAPYALTRVQPIDMFPHTAYVETVAVLARQSVRG